MKSLEFIKGIFLALCYFWKTYFIIIIKMCNHIFNHINDVFFKKSTVDYKRPLKSFFVQLC
jgi:hypothetical protein